MISPHHPDDDGVLRPVVPSTCPYRAETDPTPCKVAIHGWRDRKVGPGHPLGVARCSVHGRAFTLYPPGWTPYGRAPLAPARSDGQPVGPRPVERWAPTQFGAALDAAAARVWPREGAYTETGRWATQGRLLTRLALLVGVDGAGDGDHVHAVAQVLGVPTQVVLDAAATASAAGLRGRSHTIGTAIRAVLEALPAHHDAYVPLARVGHAVGLWGPVFRVVGTRPPRLQRLFWLRVNDFDP